MNNIRKDPLGESVYLVFVGKPKGKTPLERPTLRWVFNIRIDLWGVLGVQVLHGEIEGKESTGDTWA